jgi:hypothetical protein
VRFIASAYLVELGPAGIARAFPGTIPEMENEWQRNQPAKSLQSIGEIARCIFYVGHACTMSVAFRGRDRTDE